MSLLCNLENHIWALMWAKTMDAYATRSYTASLVHVVRANKHHGLGALTS